MNLELDVETQGDIDAPTPSHRYPYYEERAFFPEHLQAQDIVTLEDLHMVVDVVAHSSEHQEAEVKNAVFRLLAFVVSNLSTPTHFIMMATILDPIFLTSILIQRRNLRANGYRAPYSPSSPSIVTWIDTILFRIGEAIIRLADPRPNSAGSLGVSALLRCTKFVKDEVKFRAVSQLPDEWSAFPGLLASPRIPPLSRRLILTLFFGVYIVSPTLASSSTGSGTGCAPKTLPPNLRDHLRSYMSLRIDEERGVMSPLDDNDLNPFPYASLLDRAEYAMALSLFALTEQTVDSIERFRPHTLSNIFVLLLTVLQPSTDSSELEGPRRLSILQTLDPAHRILLDCNYGRHFVSWTWSAWDVRSTHYPIITFLTVSWLHQLAHWQQSQQTESCRSDSEDEVSHSILVQELSRDPRSACNAMHSVLQEFSLSSHGGIFATVNPHTTYRSIQPAIFLASWACLQLVRSAKSSQTASFSRVDLVSICRILCRDLMAPAWPPNLPARQSQMLAVSYLVEMDPVTLTDVLDPMGSEHIEIDSVVPSILAYISGSPLRDSKIQEGHDHTARVSPLSIIDLLHILKTLVEMAVICLPYSKTLSNQISASRVLVSLLDWLDALAPAHSLDFDSSQLVDALISNVVLVLVGMKLYSTTARNSLDLGDNYGYSILHGLIMDRGPSDLVILCACSRSLVIFHPTRCGFASLSVSGSHLFHIIYGTDVASASLLFSPNIVKDRSLRTKMFSTLQNVEQWNYLREALLLIVGHHWHSTVEDQILAEVVATSICSTLLEKMYDLEVQARAFPDFRCCFMV